MGVAGTTNIMKVHLVGHILVSGRGLDSINATANVCVATSYEELKKSFCDGDIVVTNNVTKNMIPILKKSAGIISEEVGVAKPDARIFDYALAQAGNPPRSRVLMVGDTAESDIRGGVNAGLATCWFNPHQRELPADLRPDWTVTSLSELEQLLCKQ